jgi:hypothetical protein
LEEISLGFVERFFFPTVLGALGLFIIWAAIGLKYHPASRLRARASNGMHGKMWTGYRGEPMSGAAVKNEDELR